MDLGGLTLSYSSSNLILGCEQKYTYYKVDKVDKDIDAEDSTTAFDIGKAFHQILEDSNHRKPKSITEELAKCTEEYNLDEQSVALVHAMVLRYLRGTKGNGFEVVKCELKIQNEHLLGFIDLISKREDGGWVIADLKTAKTFYPTTRNALAMNVQLNLYSYFVPEIAEALNLEVDKFLGTSYRVTTKPGLKRRKTESYEEYVLRLTEAAKFYDCFIPKEELRPEQFYMQHVRLYETAIELHRGERKPIKNFNHCSSYFRPCEYWSRCHGKCFTEIEVIDNANKS